MQIEDISGHRVFNSHVEPTTEVVVRLVGGGSGRSAPSHGETIGIYEDAKGADIGDLDWADALIGKEWSQASLDAWLAERFEQIGQNMANAVSEAFFFATGAPREPLESTRPPKLLINVLNGGWHAYTNPVASEFSEFMVLCQSEDLSEAVDVSNRLQTTVRQRLLTNDKTVVGGNPVNVFPGSGNLAVLDFLRSVTDDLGLTDSVALYVDASAGDLRAADGSYTFDITGGDPLTSSELVDFWVRAVDEHGLGMIEDPFAEDDYDSWRELVRRVGDRAVVIGDNFYSTDAGRIREGAAQAFATGAILKPNQAGTVTGSREAVRACRETGQIAITSHRSVSTESTFVSWLSVAEQADAIKIGPLNTDYSSVLRLNELLRLTGDAS